MARFVGVENPRILMATALNLYASMACLVGWAKQDLWSRVTVLECIYKPHCDYQNFSPLANGQDSNRQKYAILQTHWH